MEINEQKNRWVVPLTGPKGCTPCTDYPINDAPPASLKIPFKWRLRHRLGNACDKTEDTYAKARRSQSQPWLDRKKKGQDNGV